MFTPAGAVSYAYGPQSAGCVPYWMLAAAAAGGSPAAARVALQAAPRGPSPGDTAASPARAPAAPYLPSSAAAYQDLLKRTAQLNELLYPSVIPLPGTFSANDPSSALRGSVLHSFGPEPCVTDPRTPGKNLSPHGPLSPTAVKSRDLKFGIDRILLPSPGSEHSSSKGNENTEARKIIFLLGRGMSIKPVVPCWMTQQQVCCKNS